MSTQSIERRRTRRGPAHSGRVMHAISWVLLGLAAAQAFVAAGVVLLPAPASSEGGLLAGAVFLAYFAGPQLFLAWSLRSSARFWLTVTAVTSICLVPLYLVPIFVGAAHGWQGMVAQVLAAVTALVDAVVFVAAGIAVFDRRSISAAEPTLRNR